MPWYAKALAIVVAAYALSPVDPIPDFIPVLGYLDDLLLVPLGILLAIQLTPAGLMAEFRREAEQRIERPTSRIAAAAIVAIWLIVAGLMLWRSWPHLAG